MRPHMPLILTSLILLACSSQTEKKQHRFEVTTINGIETAINNEYPKFSDPLFRYEEVLRLREDPENEDSLIYLPKQFLQDEDGYFYVVDRGNTRIAAFDRNGDFIKGIGGSGGGPGEFDAINPIRVHRGVIQVFDNRRSRLTRFETDGTLIDVTSLNLIAHELISGSLSSLSNAYITLDNKLLLFSQEKERSGEFILSGRKVIALDSDREIEWQVTTPLHMMQNFTERGMGVLTPYRSRGSIQYDPDHGILISPGNDHILFLYDIDGSMKQQIRIDLEEKSITATDRARVLDSFDQRIADASEGRAAMLQAMKDATVFPERLPYWEGASWDNYGYIWLETTEHDTDRMEAGGGFLYMVLSPEGEYLGNTRHPLGNICYGRLLVISTDEETGVKNLIVYQIQSAISGFIYP